MAVEGKKQRKRWEDVDMKAALDAVANGTKTVTRAAATYHVPQKTLDDRDELSMVRSLEGILSLLLKKRKPCVATSSTWLREGFL